MIYGWGRTCHRVVKGLVLPKGHCAQELLPVPPPGGNTLGQLPYCAWRSSQQHVYSQLASYANVHKGESVTHTIWTGTTISED